MGYYTLNRYTCSLCPNTWEDLPFYILNKGIALSAFVLLTFNFSFGPLTNLGVNVPLGLLNARKALGMTGFLLVIIHTLISFLLFRSAVFGKFFQKDGTLTLSGGLSMLGGVLLFVFLWVYSLRFLSHLREDETFTKFINSRIFLLSAMLFGLMHIFFMGFKGWVKPDERHGGLPPISLIGFVFFWIAYVINLLGRIAASVVGKQMKVQRREWKVLRESGLLFSLLYFQIPILLISLVYLGSERYFLKVEFPSI